MEMLKNKSRDLLNHIEGFLGYVTEVSLHFEEAVKDYILGRTEDFEKRRIEVAAIERKADDALKTVKYELYAYKLIPDTRADVFKLMGDMDDVVDFSKDLLMEISIEKPVIPEFLQDDMIRLSEASSKAVSSLVRAVRAFFSDLHIVDDRVSKVVFYEEEADKLEESIKRRAFSSEEIDMLSRKVQIRYFTERIALLSDISEDISKNVLIYAVKRKI